MKKLIYKQWPDESITIYIGNKALHGIHLTNEEALKAAYALMSFARGQQIMPKCVFTKEDQ